MSGPYMTNGAVREDSLVPSQLKLRVLRLTRFSHQLTVEARHRPAITSLRLLTVLNVGSSTPALFKKLGAERRAPCTGEPLAHFASPAGEKRGLINGWGRSPSRPIGLRSVAEDRFVAISWSEARIGLTAGKNSALGGYGREGVELVGGIQ